MHRFRLAVRERLLTRGRYPWGRSTARFKAAVAWLALASLLLIACGSTPDGQPKTDLLQVYTAGYRYDPRTESPDPRLIGGRPEVMLGRQLDALLGKTGPAPLRADAALAGYEIEEVVVDGWPGEYPTARITARLEFDDGTGEPAQFELIASGASFLPVPVVGEMTRQVTGWRPNSLTRLFQALAPATPLSTSAPPVTLRPVDSIGAGHVGSGRVDIAVPSDIGDDGRLLFD